VLYKHEELDDATCSTALGVLTGLARDVRRDDTIFTVSPSWPACDSSALPISSCPTR